MRVSFALVIFVGATLAIACDKDSAPDKGQVAEEGAAAEGPGNNKKGGKLPEQYWGSYQGPKHEAHKLTLTPSGLSTTGKQHGYSWESQSVKFDSVTCEKSNCDWTGHYTEYGSQKVAEGSIVLMKDGSLLVTTQGLGSKDGDAYASGKFVTAGATPPPQPKVVAIDETASPVRDDSAAMAAAAVPARAEAVPARAEAVPARAAMGSTATISVKINDRKPNGKAWDAFGGQPDISICVSGGGSTQCYPDGGSVLEIMEPQCRDSFRCTFSGVKVPDGSFTVTVVDVDFAANDRAGSASCKKGGSCSGGSASISVR